MADARNRNPALVPGIERFSRTDSRKARRFHKLKKVTPAAAKGKARAPRAEGAFYTVDVPHRKLARDHTPKPARLRPSITPGTVLILLAGRFRGKRVVFIKQLESGLLLVSGPLSINGVPLRRVNQAYAIATSTHVDISKLKVPADVSDAWFQKEKGKAAKKSAEDLLGGSSSAPKKEIPQARKDAQAKIDAFITKQVEAVPLLKEYLKSKFTLRSGQYPHLLKF